VLDVQHRRFTECAAQLRLMRVTEDTPSTKRQGRSMDNNGNRERATEPEDLSRFIVQRANAGDVEGVVALYESTAVVASPPGQVATGVQSIRHVYKQLLASKPIFKGEIQAALRVGDLALTSTHFDVSVVGSDGKSATVPVVTADVARRQTDGT
jgi:ketosteroid isomerase-like protein